MQSEMILVGPTLIRRLEKKTLQKLQLESIPQLAIDGGIRFTSDAVLWLGDQDSGIANESIPALKKTNQNETDLRFALNYLKQSEWTRLHLFGFLGGRKDHELANWGEVYQEMKVRPFSKVAIFYDDAFLPAIYLYQKGQQVFNQNGIFSLLAFEQAQVSLSGKCQFQVQNQDLKPFSGRGISNVGSGEIELNSTAPILLFLNQEAK